MSKTSLDHWSSSFYINLSSAFLLVHIFRFKLPNYLGPCPGNHKWFRDVKVTLEWGRALELCLEFRPLIQLWRLFLPPQAKIINNFVIVSVDIIHVSWDTIFPKLYLNLPKAYFLLTEHRIRQTRKIKVYNKMLFKHY